jgi:DNA-binding MarR family transcriptional regulator
MAELDEHVVAPARLKLMTTLTAVSEAEFATLRDALQAQRFRALQACHRLERAGYVKRRKGVHRGRRTTWISLNARGRRALSVHVAALCELIDPVEHLRSAAPPTR